MSLRTLFLPALLCLLISPVLSQKEIASSHSCGITTSIKEASKKDGYTERLFQYQKKVAEIVSKKLKNNNDSTIPCPNGITIIPIAFHLFHEPNAAIGEQHNFDLPDLHLVVDYLNMHFSGINPRKEILGDAFANVDAGNTCIQFTIGKVNRIDTESCEHWNKNVTQYQLHKCLPGGSGEGSKNDPNDFLNIYVTELYGGLLGQASNIPGILGRSNADSDGITISRNIVIPGENNSTLYDKGGILAHEIGHWLGLAHVDGDIQGSGCEGDDGIEDTFPQEKKNTYVCSEALPHSCGTLDNVYNYMDYSMDCAKLMFTKQQAIIMNDILLNDRRKLSTSYERMDKTKPLYELESKEEFSMPIKWVLVDCQDRINLLEFQQKWTIRSESNQSFSGSTNYYWERTVTGSSDRRSQVLDDRYLSNHNVLSGISELKSSSIVIYRLKEQSWATSLKKYESTKTRGILLVRVSSCPSPVNDKLEDAIVLNQGILCSEDTYSLLYANGESDTYLSRKVAEEKDVWFKMNLGDEEEIVEIMIKRPNSGAANPMIEAYDKKMNSLKVVESNNNSESNYRIEKNVGMSEIYIRAFDIENPIADPFSICRIENADLNDNCMEAYDVSVLRSCQWLGYSFEGSTPSSELQANYNCGADKEFYDVWFETTVPNSGHFSVKCKNKIGVKNDLLLEVYSGSCEKKELIGCQMVYGISGANPMAYLPFVGLKSGEKIFIRVGGNGYGQKGDFEMCVSKSFENICIITKVEVGETLNCNSNNNTYSQELIVSYQSTGALNKLIVNGQYFTLMENPQKIILRDLPSNKLLSIKANLLNLEDPSCWNNSTYAIEAIHSKDLPCTDTNTKNNECFDAEPIAITADCNSETYSLFDSDASKYKTDNGCIEEQKDRWFEVIVPSSGELSIGVFSESEKSDLVFEIYQGICEEKRFLICSAGIDKDSNALVLKELESGTILYIRVADYKNNDNASFSLCVREPDMAKSRSIETPLPQDDVISFDQVEAIASIHCFPNPTVDFLDITLRDFDEKSTHRISLIDSNGRIVIESNLTSRNFRMDLSAVSSGIYVLLVEDGMNRQIKKIVRS